VRHRDQSRLSRQRRRQEAHPRHPGRPVRPRRRPRRRAAAARLRRRTVHRRRHHRGRRRPDGRAERLRNTMDFTLSPEIEDLRLPTRAFVETHVLPLEREPANFSEHENIPSDRLEPVRAKAKAAGLWAPQSPKEFGGMALPIVAWAAIYEEA